MRHFLRSPAQKQDGGDIGADRSRCKCRIREIKFHAITSVCDSDTAPAGGQDRAGQDTRELTVVALKNFEYNRCAANLAHSKFISCHARTENFNGQRAAREEEVEEDEVVEGMSANCRRRRHDLRGFLAEKPPPSLLFPFLPDAQVHFRRLQGEDNAF